jgi:hypothetical protein
MLHYYSRVKRIKLLTSETIKYLKFGLIDLALETSIY